MLISTESFCGFVEKFKKISANCPDAKILLQRSELDPTSPQLVFAVSFQANDNRPLYLWAPAAGFVSEEDEDSVLVMDYADAVTFSDFLTKSGSPSVSFGKTDDVDEGVPCALEAAGKTLTGVAKASYQKRLDAGMPEPEFELEVPEWNLSLTRASGWIQFSLEKAGLLALLELREAWSEPEFCTIHNILSSRAIEPKYQSLLSRFPETKPQETDTMARKSAAQPSVTEPIAPPAALDIVPPPAEPAAAPLASDAGADDANQQPPAPAQDGATQQTQGKRKRRSSEEVLEDRVKEATELLTANGYSVTKADGTGKKTVTEMLDDLVRLAEAIETEVIVLQNAADKAEDPAKAVETAVEQLTKDPEKLKALLLATLKA